MNKKFLVAALAAFSLFVSCEDSKSTCVVVFMNGEDVAKTVVVEKGSTVADPHLIRFKWGECLYGWKKDGEDFSFSTPITEDTFLDANWLTASDGITYEASGDDYMATAVSVTGDTVVFASFKDGKKVLTIGNGSALCTTTPNYTEVVIPESVTTIGASAFSGWSSVTKMRLPVSLTSIGKSALYGMSKLDSVELPESLATIDGGAFAFSGIKEITIPSTVTTVDNFAVKGCGELTKATVKCDLTGVQVFSSCSKLSDVVFAEGVKGTGESTFMNCSALVNVTLPRTLKTIGAACFEKCTSLESLTIPKGVTNIGEAVFNGASKLNTITYTGTQAEWNAIIKDSNWRSGSSLTTIKCSDGDINLQLQ